MGTSRKRGSAIGDGAQSGSRVYVEAAWPPLWLIWASTGVPCRWRVSVSRRQPSTPPDSSRPLHRGFRRYPLDSFRFPTSDCGLSRYSTGFSTHPQAGHPQSWAACPRTSPRAGLPPPWAGAWASANLSIRKGVRTCLMHLGRQPRTRPAGDGSEQSAGAVALEDGVEDAPRGNAVAGAVELCDPPAEGAVEGVVGELVVGDHHRADGLEPPGSVAEALAQDQLAGAGTHHHHLGDHLDAQR